MPRPMQPGMPGGGQLPQPGQPGPQVLSYRQKPKPLMHALSKCLPSVSALEAFLHEVCIHEAYLQTVQHPHSNHACVHVGLYLVSCRQTLPCRA